MRIKSVWLNRVLDCVWNVMAHAHKPYFVFRRNGRVLLNRRGLQFSRLLAAEVCASAVVMLDAPCSEVVWRVLAIHSIRQFPLLFPCRGSPCAITFQMDSTHTFEELSHNFEKRLSASSRLPICPYRTTDFQLDGFSWNIYIWVFFLNISWKFTFP